MVFAPRERGQGFVEYGFIIILVAIFIIVVLVLLGPTIANMYNQLIPLI